MLSVLSYEVFLHFLRTETPDRFEANASKNWDDFYKTNTTNFFKDRHWILREFPELETWRKTNPEKQMQILEIGCGVGNTTFPVLEEISNCFFHSFDFSATAVKLLKENTSFDPAKCNAFVLDVVHQDIPVKDNSIDIVIIIFVLSAISPEHFQSIVAKIHKALVPGGYVLIRDYGKGDMAEARFENSSKVKKISESFYVRKDGTRAYYFSIEEMETLFAKQFDIVTNQFITRQIQNKKESLTMDRKWIQSTFRKK